ncbi:MAG TPA: segregation/condensation protein A [Candidatus Kapabacteria bacterium]|nr:segregation/condensation protein A [Candidatus Kapabacteria bacterium]
MPAQITLEQFSGPFDLLLTLIDKQKVSITEIALADVTEQFLTHLDTLEANREEELADFLVVASRLLLLKSKMLLPQFLPEEEDGPGLEEQLKLYKQFVDASKRLNALWLDSRESVFREEPSRMPEGFHPGDNVTLERIHATMVQLVRRLTPPKPLPETHIDRAVSMKERIDHIRRVLERSSRLSFHEVLENATNKTEIIVSFLAILELLKQKTIFLHQEDTFADIVIERA